MVYAFDYQSPTLKSVTAEVPFTIELQFSEKLDPTNTNITPINFHIYSAVVSNTGVKSAVLNSEGTKVTLTLYKNSFLNPFTVADYIVSLGKTDSPIVNVSDIAGNEIYDYMGITFSTQMF